MGIAMQGLIGAEAERPFLLSTERCVRDEMVRGADPAETGVTTLFKKNSPSV
jgi:hypothetical protein